jgi:hypothetical protein
VWLLAEQMETATRGDFEKGWGGLIFMGCFILFFLILGVWWISRKF